MTPAVPDGPDTELAAAIGFLARNEGLLIEMEHSPAGRAAATIVRAVLARDVPAPAGRDLTAQDVENVIREVVDLRAEQVSWEEIVRKLRCSNDRAWGRVYDLHEENFRLRSAGRDLTAQDVGVALDGVTHLSRQIRDEVARELNGIARPAVARTDGQTPAPQEEHGPFEVDETIRLEGAILRLRESLADVPAAIATVRDVWANGSPEARGFLRLPDAGSWPDLARALDTLCAISAGQKGREHRAYEEWAAAQAADGQPPADLEGQALVDALVAAGWTRTGGQSGRYVRLKRDVPISNTALVPLDTSASDYTDLLDTARAEIGAVLAAPVVGYVLARVDDGTVTLWDDDVRETGHAVAVAHVEQVDQPGPWRCYELRDVCIPAGQPVRRCQPEATDG